MSGWIRYRFQANYGDPRPVIFPPPGPWWCTGEAGDASYSVVVAYLPPDVHLASYWPEAADIDATPEDGIVFTDRFPRPEWWTAEAEEGQNDG